MPRLTIFNSFAIPFSSYLNWGKLFFTTLNFLKKNNANFNKLKSGNKYFFPNILLIYIIFNFLRSHLIFE
jgi:hypothetical protein